MKFEPYTGNRYKARPVALVRPGAGVLTVWSEDHPEGETHESGIRGALHALEGHRVYCTTGVTTLRQVIDARNWIATVWNGRASSMHLVGSKLHVGNLRGALDTSPDPWGDLTTFLDWVKLRGVNPASVGTMSMNMWRSTLDHTLELDSDPVHVTPAFFGGRQEAQPGNYRHLAHYDIQAAYPTSMAADDYAATLRHVNVDPSFSSVEPGIARASIIIPPMRWGPLPWRHEDFPEVVLYPTDGTLDGTWSLIELEEARRLGCYVRVHEAWVPQVYCRPFDAWWPLMREGRALPGAAGTLAKMMANTLWGTFAMEGAPTKWKWSTKHGTDTPRPVETTAAERRNLPHARTRHIAVETTARVRLRILREGLYGSPVPPLHVDTDGIIIRGSVPCPAPSGDRPGQWREKWRCRVIEIVAPQTYRLTCGHGCGVTHARWHYVSAGRTPAEAAEHWRADVAPLTSSMVVAGQGVSLNLVMERRLAAARIAQSHHDMSARDSRFPDLSSEEQERMMVP